MRKRTSRLRVQSTLLGLALTLSLAGGTALAGTWGRLANDAPGPVQLMMLLPDGTVMAANPGVSNAWYKLTPDIHGSYANGSWTTLASMANTRLYYSSIVLPDGRVFVAGAEYGTGASTAEIYDPQANSWTMINPPTSVIDPSKRAGCSLSGNQAFLDSGAVLLSNGKILIAPVLEAYCQQTILYDPGANSWSAGATAQVNTQNEATWVKLPDDTILTIDPGSPNSERYIPSSNTWFRDSSLTNSVYDSVGGEIGPALMLPDGHAFFIGANGNTALYLPSLTPHPTQGTWSAGPNIPNIPQFHHADDGSVDRTDTVSGGTPDGPAAMLTNGHVLCAFSGQLYNDPRGGTNISDYWKNRKNPQYPDPVSFFEFNPDTNAFMQIPSPTNPGTANSTDIIAVYQSAMLALPDGNILYAHQNTDLYLYTPTGGPIPEGKPTISGLSNNFNGSYHLTGKLFNGLSQGASYGDDLQMDSNYPIVRLTDSSGNVYFARSFFWSTTSVSTANATVSTEFWLTGQPAIGGGGTYSLSVVANGISSDPITFPGPVWVDFTFAGSPKLGTFDNPYPTLAEGINAISPGGTLVLKGPRSTSERVTTLSKPMTIISVGGTATMGR